PTRQPIDPMICAQTVRDGSQSSARVQWGLQSPAPVGRGTSGLATGASGSVVPTGAGNEDQATATEPSSGEGASISIFLMASISEVAARSLRVASTSPAAVIPSLGAQKQT